MIERKLTNQPGKDLNGFCEWAANSSWGFISSNITKPESLHLIADALNRNSESTLQHWFVTNGRLDFHHLDEHEWDWTSDDRPDTESLQKSNCDGSTLVKRKEYSALLKLYMSVGLYLTALKGGFKQWSPQARLGNRSALQCLTEAKSNYQAVTILKENEK
jgi:hypothetical protein